MLPHSDTFLGLKTAQRPFSCLVFGWTQCSIWQERIRLQTGDEFSGSQSSKRPKHAPDCLFFVLIPGIRIRRNAGRVLVLETRGGSWTPDSPSESSRNPNLRPGHVSKIAARRLRSVSRKVFFPDGFDSPRKPKIGRSDGNHSRPVALQRDEPANPVGTLSEFPRTSALLQTSPRLAVRGLRAFPRRPPAPRPTPSALWILPAPNHFLPIWDSGLSESLRACYRESSAPRFRALPRRAARRLPRGFRKRHAIRTRHPECVVSVFGARAIAVSRHTSFETISHPHRM